MAVYEKNVRLFQVIDDLKSNGYISDYSELAGKLGISKQNLSHIKNSVKKLSLDLLESLKIIYPNINLDYIIVGVGGYYISSAVADNTEVNHQDEGLIKIIQTQARELGKLEARIDMYQEEISLLKKELDYQYTTAHSDIAQGGVEAG